MNDLPNVQQALAAIKDPALADQNAVLETVTDEIAGSKLAIKEYDRMIADMQEQKRKARLHLTKLEKRAKVFRRAVFDLRNINIDHDID